MFVGLDVRDVLHCYSNFLFGVSVLLSLEAFAHSKHLKRLMIPFLGIIPERHMSEGPKDRPVLQYSTDFSWGLNIPRKWIPLVIAPRAGLCARERR